jgi:elongation factor 1-beta
MARLIARVRILPAEADSDLESIILSLKQKTPNRMEMKAYEKEPIAFGLNAIVGDFLIDDMEGQMDSLEESIKEIQGVGEIEVIYIGRESVSIKKC